MNLPKSLITKLVDHDALNQVTRAGITQEFLDEESSIVFNYINRYYVDYKRTPSRDAVLQAFPNYQFENHDEPLEYFINELKETYRRAILEDALYQVSKIYNKNSKEAESLLRELLGNLSVTQKSFKDLNLAQTALDRIKGYENKKENPGADGILSGWSRVDYVTLGWHPEEFILLVGEKYQGKSWLMIWLAYQAALRGERVLFVTKEMSQIAMARRFDSIYAGVKFDSLRRGELTDHEEERFRSKLGELNKSNIQITFARDGVDTIEEIERKAVELDATIAFADSVYLFNPDHRSPFQGETPRRMAISQRCKAAARTLSIPFVASTQAGRKKSKEGPNLDDIEWSNSFSQDADVVMMVAKNEVDKELNRLQMHVLKTRDGDITSSFIGMDFEYMKFEESKDKPEPTTNIEIDDNESMFE